MPSKNSKGHAGEGIQTQILDSGAEGIDADGNACIIPDFHFYEHQAHDVWDLPDYLSPCFSFLEGYSPQNESRTSDPTLLGGFLVLLGLRVSGVCLPKSQL